MIGLPHGNNPKVSFRHEVFAALQPIRCDTIRSESLQITTGETLLISCRSLEFDAVTFGVSQVNGRAFALGTVAQRL
jgi:hypothetical protein